MKRTRISLLLTAALLAVTTLSLGLSYTLTGYDSLVVTTSLGKTSDFGITLSSPSLDPILFPDQDYNFNVNVTPANGIPTYLIAKVELPSDFVADGNTVFSPEGWERLETDSSGETLEDVYYYGSDDAPVPVSDSATLISSVRLADHVEVLSGDAEDIVYSIRIQVWGFHKTSETEAMSPGVLWDEVKRT